VNKFCTAHFYKKQIQKIQNKLYIIFPQVVEKLPKKQLKGHRFAKKILTIFEDKKL